jgi:hypothetical protein
MEPGRISRRPPCPSFTSRTPDTHATILAGASLAALVLSIPAAHASGGRLDEDHVSPLPRSSLVVAYVRAQQFGNKPVKLNIVTVKDDLAEFFDRFPE